MRWNLFQDFVQLLICLRRERTRSLQLVRQFAQNVLVLSDTAHRVK